MKKINLIPLLLLFILLSCAKPENEPLSFEFSEQILQGKIGGKSWVFMSGNAKISNNIVKIHLYNKALDTLTLCGDKEIKPGTDYIYFDTPASVEVNEFCVYNCENNRQDVYIFDQKEQRLIVASTGKIQLTKIDTENRIVEGKLVTQSGEPTFLNGNFTLALCQ